MSGEFLHLIDRAIREAEELRARRQAGLDPGTVAQPEIAIRNLRALQGRTERGDLELPTQRPSLGLVRFIGEWAEGTNLMETVREIERRWREEARYAAHR